MQSESLNYQTLLYALWVLRAFHPAFLKLSLKMNKFQGWTRQKLIDRVEALEKQTAVDKSLVSNKENSEWQKKHSKLQGIANKLEQEKIKLQQSNTNLESKFKELYADYESHKEASQIKLNKEQLKVNEKIQEIHKLQKQKQRDESGFGDVIDDLQNRLTKSQKDFEGSRNEISQLKTESKEEITSLIAKLAEKDDAIMDLQSQIKELQQLNVHELDDSMEMLEIPNRTETTTLYSELEDQRLDLSQRYNKLLRQYRYLRSQQSLYSMKSSQDIYDLENKLIELTSSLNEVKLVKVNEMMVFKNDLLPNGELNYLSSGYGHKHELINRTLHKQVNDLMRENEELRRRYLSCLKKSKVVNDKMQELNQMMQNKEISSSPSKRTKLNQEQEQSECKTQ
eukprot:NODE_92_length_21718_cov_0.361950.p7 type:complete len:396 gc:universal NODE_92_length_21718_cov_0.361950:11244-12431(+)